jgi:hypothetical protein
MRPSTLNSGPRPLIPDMLHAEALSSKMSSNEYNVVMSVTMTEFDFVMISRMC